MNLYIIQNDLKNIIYVVSKNIENAIEEYKKTYDSKIISINFVSKNIIINK